MLEELKLLVHSKNALLSLVTHDEESAAEVVRAAAEHLGAPLYEWSATTGLRRTRPGPGISGAKRAKASEALDHVLENLGGGGIYLFKDLGPHCKDPLVRRQLRDVYADARVTLVLLDDEPLPDAVRRLTVLLEWKLPGADELERVVRDTFRQVRAESYTEVTSSLTKADLEHIVQTLRGLTCGEAARVVAAAIYRDGALTADDLPRIVEAKRNLLRSAGCLESVTVNVEVEEVGGLEGLKRWLARRRGGATAKAREFGLEPPRGILLLGVQGCGKSLCAKMVASAWRQPLLRMDPGVLYQKYIGESENRLRDALAQAEAMAPAVLWIDEIEKAFASASSTSADGGLSQRMFGTLLSWMQDHRSPIFIVATANNIESLPPELMRKGRFDEVFFVDLPGAAARREVLSIHLRRRKRDPARFAVAELAEATEGFSGAELEQVVVSALYAAFAEGAELTDAHLLAEVRATKPLSVLMGERVRALRAWARDRCVPAD